MSPDRICKTVRQYNKVPIPQEDMAKLLRVAVDYKKIKNHVYQRYGGIGGLSKIYPGYTVQNEMTGSGLRAELGMPSVYFYLAVFEALGDIKAHWSRTKKAVLVAVNSNGRFTPEDRHYLRFVIKDSGCFENILNGKAVVVPELMREQYRRVCTGVDTENLNRYLGRQVRGKLAGLYTDKAEGFAISERAYRYGHSGKEHGIFISTKEKRKRVFIALTDDNEYKRQLYVKLKPEQRCVEIAVPIETRARKHADYVNQIGLSAGMWQMLTTDQGVAYGERFGELHKELADFISAGQKTYHREKGNNPGREKYFRRKQKLGAQLESYVNQEINRMLAQEKPSQVYMPKFPQGSMAGVNGKINHSVTVWRKGFIKKRLAQKCLEHGIELVEVLGKGISTECSECGMGGVCQRDVFRCGNCGHEGSKKTNAARNALKRGQGSGRINTMYVTPGDVPRL